MLEDLQVNIWDACKDANIHSLRYYDRKVKTLCILLNMFNAHLYYINYLAYLVVIIK